MITTIVLNPAVDKIYFVDNFEPGNLYRVRDTVISAGGKGINVARVASILGEKVTAIGFKGGQTGNWLEDQLKKLGVFTNFIEVQGESRTNNNIIDRKNDTETEVLETGPYIHREDLGKFLLEYDKVLKDTELLVCSGGLPNGVSTDIYKALIDKARAYGIKVLLDSSGEVLQKGIEAKPYMIKPNLKELSSLVQKELVNIDDILKACRSIVSKGVEIVAASMGEKGALLISKKEELWAKVPSVDIKNTIGCGDSLVAGFAAGLRQGCSLVEAFRLGTACSVNNAQFVEIGVVDKLQVEELKGSIQIERL